MPLFCHQQEYVDRYWDQVSHGMWWNLGTGKTAALLNVALRLYSTEKIKGVIVIAPAECYLNWLEQVQIHTPEILATAWSSAYPARSIKALNRTLAMPGLKMFVINVEALSREESAAYRYALEFIKYIGPTLVVVDESNCIKNPKANCTKNVLRIGRYAKYRRCLNGTPGIESPFDVWQQLEFLRPGVTEYNYFMFTKAYGIYQRAYFGPRSFDKCVGYKNVDEIRELLNKCGHFVRKEEVLDLPPKMYETHEYDMPQDTWRIYNRLKRDKVMYIEDIAVTSRSALGTAIQMHDLACGFVKHDDGRIEWVSNARFLALMSLLEMIDGKAIIYCSSRPALARLEVAITDKYGVESCRVIHGDVDIPDRVDYIEDFQTKPMVRYLIANQQTAGRGITLTAASYVIYFRNSYSLDDRVQSEDRAHRIGQKGSVTIIDIVARKTIDERIINLLKQKKDVATMLSGVVQAELTEEHSGWDEDAHRP